MISCSAILFDMDGTLIDSGTCVERQWARWARKHALRLEDVLRVSHGRRTVETMQLLAPHLDQPSELNRFLQDEAADLDDVQAFDGAAALLAALPGDRWAIVTSSSESVARARLRHCGFPKPRVLVAADHVKRGKPDPEPYLTAARLLGHRPQDCVVFEDAKSGIAAGRAAGMTVVGVAWAREQLDSELTIESFEQIRIEPGLRIHITR